MKHLFFAFLFCLPFSISAQTLDSIAVVREVDSLRMAATELWRSGNPEDALILAQQAVNISKQTWGENNVSYAASLHRLASVYNSLNQNDKAESLYLEAIRIRSKVLGKEHPDYIGSLSNLAILYHAQGNFPEAEKLLLEIVSIRSKVLGKEHPDYAKSLNNLAVLYMDKSDFVNAEPLYLEAKEIWAKALGKEHPDYITSLYNLAVLYMRQGDYAKAEPLYLEVIAMRAKVLGKKHPDYAMALNALANLYAEKGDFTKAEPLCLEGKEILAKALGQEHPDYAMFLNNFANMYGEKGDYAKAEPLFLEAKEIWAKTLGKEYPGYINSLNNLGNLYGEKGDYAKAEPLFLEAKEIRAKTLGREHPDYASSLHALAGLYFEKGDYAKAEPLFMEAIEIQAKVLGKEHPSYGASLNDLANLYLHLEEVDYAKVESLYLEAKRIFATALSREHPYYANTLNNLAMVYDANGDYAKAESLYLETIEIRAKVLGKEHQDYATSLNNLARSYSDRGQYAKAELLYLEAKEVLAKALGKEHPDYATVLNNLTLLYQATSRVPEAEPLFLELNGLIRRLIESSALYSSESQMLAYLQTFDDDLAQFQTFSQTYSTPEFICASFDNALFYNGYLLENARNLARAVAKADSLTRYTFDRWQGCKRRLANEYTKPIAERRYVTETEAEAEGYEKTLTRKIPVFGTIRHTPHWQDVRNHLHKGEAAVEFIHYRYYNPKETDSTIYAALVLLPGDTCPHFVPLCEQRALDSLLRIAHPDQRYERTGSGSSLYSLLWQPIESLLQGKATVYYAPNGLLHSVNLDAVMLNLHGDSTLIDRYKLVRLGSTRQLVAPVKAAIAGNDALLFGGIRYDPDSTAIQKQNDLNGTTMRGGSATGLPGPADSLQQIWAYLPNSLKEVEFIRQLMEQKKFKARLFSGFGASEEAFKQFADSMSAKGASARVLHLTTHGYFSPDPKISAHRNKRGFSDGPAFIISEHPYLRSGLVLAGGNHAWKTGKPFKAGMEDGILTAYEISAMSLRNTELVVLSACETGLGDLSGNEGVYGLQRAFKIAGVQYLIMSLWPVPDIATKDLMSAFYHNWLGMGKDIPTAFRTAQLEMKKRNRDPETWAGFVLVH